jgi:hypothetical protein
MENVLIRRRTLLLSGLAAGLLAVVPLSGLCLPVGSGDFDDIGSDAADDSPYKASITGSLTTEESANLVWFANWAISAWAFIGMENYNKDLMSALQQKTYSTPSYLEEYRSAANLIHNSKSRLPSEQEAFLYLMFAERGGQATLATRLGRARKYVFDEFVMHIVANGGFRRFGFVNYGGRINLPFTDPKSYRRA